MTVAEFLRQINEVLGAPELAARTIASTVSVGQDFGEGSELSALFFYLLLGEERKPAEVAVVDARCEE
jgi:hypothetical protein